MNWLNKLEYRYGHICIPGLMRYIIIGQAAVWVVVMLFWQNLYGLLTLSKRYLMRGELWRLISFIFLPNFYGYTSLFAQIFVTAIALYFYYFIGTALERQWGSFRFNLYYLMGIVGAWIACFLCGIWDGAGLLLSLFLAFAYLFPENRVLQFYVIPVKVKWLGWGAGALWAFNLLSASLPAKLGLIAELLGFWVFFGPTLWRDIEGMTLGSYRRNKRRNDWNNQWRR